MLTLKNLTLAYGPKVLINNANLQLYKGYKVGLVGRNGSGKTSLFKLLLGINHAEQGECDLPQDTLISYIEQEIEDNQQQLIEYVLNAHQLYTSEQTDLPEYYQLRPNAEKLLINLGFSEEELTQPLASFSGGWQMRANLAKALFCPSDLLLLDEPTNHLDIETVMWLENWLQRYPGLALIISHDREFLDNTTSHTLHIANQSLNLYSGNYTNFERTLAEHQQQQQKAAAATKAKIAHLQSFVDRFKAKASKAKQAQSRMKMIEKLQYSPTFTNERDYHLEFLEPLVTSDLLLTVIDAEIGYPQKSLMEQVNLQIYAGDRIGLLGKNGKGKTSLIKAILEQTTLLHGSVELANKVKVGYFAQQTVEALNNNDTPLNIISAVAPELKQQEMLNYLGRYGFAAATARESIANFSGGEKARLILAALIIQRPNLLFLDEPTNHLDISMREELAAALQDFSGAVVLVSHDQFLLESVVDDFYLIDNQRLSKFNGSLSDYYAYLLKQEEKVMVAKKVPAAAKSRSVPLKQLSQLKQKISQCEQKMEKLNQQLAKLNGELEQASQLGQLTQLNQLHLQVEPLQNELAKNEEQWLIWQEQLASLTEAN